MPVSRSVVLFFPVASAEIKQNLPVKSAPGPDGLAARQLKSMPMIMLKVLLNLLMYLKKAPTTLKGARTVFILKTTRATLPSDFRPITLTPVLLRLFNKILAQRVSEVVTPDFCQRAFQPVDGCAKNVLLLSATIQEARRSLRPLYMASVYLSKAFDKVSTAAVLEGARCAGLGDSFVHYINDLYENAITILSFEQQSKVVQPTAGVRQGDSLSPFQFGDGRVL